MKTKVLGEHVENRQIQDPSQKLKNTKNLRKSKSEIENVRENGKNQGKRAAPSKCFRLPCFEKISRLA